MLLIEPPDKAQLTGIIDQLLSGGMSREEVKAWQLAVAADIGWELQLPVSDGYWYFYSLMFVDMPLPTEPGGYAIRSHDLVEYRADIQQAPAPSQDRPLQPLRTHQVDHQALLWPLTNIPCDPTAVMLNAGLIPVRGVFEPREELVEHAHLRFEGNHYLLVRQLDEYASELLVLGESRDEAQLGRLLSEFI